MNYILYNQKIIKSQGNDLTTYKIEDLNKKQKFSTFPQLQVLIGLAFVMN